MKKKGKKTTCFYFYVLILIFICKANIHAQDKIRFEHLTINEGLSQNTIFCVLQDQKGFIWIGTEDGLNRFDGYDFSIYKHDNNNKASLSHSQINALYEDRKGNLWVGTSGGLNIFDRDRERFIRVKTGATGEVDLITSLAGDSRGDIWIGTAEGIKHFNHITRQVRHFKFSPPEQVAGGNKIQTIFEDSQKVLWISIVDDLKRFDPVKQSFISLPAVLEKNTELRKSNVRVIKQDCKGNYWFGTEAAGLFKYDIEKQEITNYKHEAGNKNSLPISVIRDLFPASKSELWIGTREGLSILNLNSNRFTNYQYNPFDRKSLSHNSVRHIMKDRAGNIWIGTYAGGVNIYHSSSKNFSHIAERIGKETGLSHRVVSSILKAENGKLWVGTEGGGLNFVDRATSTFKSYVINSIQENIVKSIEKDKNGNLWIGTYDGLSYLDTKTGKFKNYRLVINEKKPGNNQIYALAADTHGVWIGTDARGLNFVDKQGKVKESYVYSAQNKNTISNNSIISLLKDEKDNLWIGTERGLNYFDKSQRSFIRFSHQENNKHSISHNTILSLFFDSKRRLWVGTEGGGLNVFDKATARFYAITEREGLPNNVIHAIQEDRSGNLWVSSNKGISKIIIKNFSLPLRKEMVSIMNYTVADGLQSNQFLTGAAEVGENGELLFGGINGITAFYPEKIIRNTFKPKVVITDFLIKNNPVDINTEGSPLTKAIEETHQITLTHDQAFVTFKFAALNYINPDKNQYAYKLEGFADDDWHYVSNQRTATYTNLDEGIYTFKVKAANNDGVWNDETLSLIITVLPPWWKTWWAYLFYALIISGLLYLFYYYSYKTATLQNQLVFEHLSREKDQELAQRKLSFFTNISHEIKTPLTLILAPIDKLLSINEGNNKTQNQLMLMQRNGQRLMRLINQLLDFRKFDTGIMKLEASEGNVVRIVREIIAAFDSYARSKRIKLVLKAEKDKISTWFDPDKIEKVMYNLLSNAFKFTPEGGRVTVYISTLHAEGKSFVVIKVEDDGMGIPVEYIDKVFDPFNHNDENKVNLDGTGIGLSFSKGLIELHRGDITVESSPADAGERGYTCFTIRIPLGKDYLKKAEINTDYKSSESITSYQETEIPLAASIKLAERKQYVLSSTGKEKLIMLVVEDNQDVLEFVASHFEQEFEIYKAENGLQGLTLAFQCIPDIIISDVMMPEMNGTKMCEELKSDTRTSHIPVILLTARTPLIYKIEGFETGADDYITKPFNLNILEARVWNLLESRQNLRERYRKEINLQPLNVAITSPDEKFLKKVMSFIEKNIDDPELSVEELGREVGMSRVTLYRKIKALTNQSAVEFIRTVRLKRAAQLLKQNKLNVSEVAYMVGFIDIDYFRRCFKEQFGHTPKEYSSFTAEKQGT